MKKYNSRVSIETEVEVDIIDHIADCDPEEVLNQIEMSDILKYVGEQFPILHNRDLIAAYYHGDFDLVGLLKELADDGVVPIQKLITA